MTVSFVGSNALADELGAAGAGVFVTQVVPFPTDDSLPVVAAYLSALSAYSPDSVPGFVSFEGYLAGRLAIAGLDGCGQEVDRTCFLNSLPTPMWSTSTDSSYDTARATIRARNAVFLTVIGSDGSYHPVNTLGTPEP